MLQGAGAFVGFGDPTGQHDSFQSSHISPVIINFMNINHDVAFSRARGQAGGVHFVCFGDSHFKLKDKVSTFPQWGFTMTPALSSIPYVTLRSLS